MVKPEQPAPMMHVVGLFVGVIPVSVVETIRGQ